MRIIVMHLYTWIALLMAITSVANSYSNSDGISDLNETYRDGKRLNGNPILTRLTRNEGCIETELDSDGNKYAVFKSQANSEGRMASNKKKRQRQKQRQEIQDPIKYKTELCPDPDVVQIKLEIVMDLNLPNGMKGDCDNEWLEFNGANKGLKIPILCGKVEDELYIDIDNSERACEILVKGKNEKKSGTFTITIRYLTESWAIPYHRCLQYKNEKTGTLKSFNYDSQPADITEPRYTSLINQRYSICFAYIEGYCDIKFEFDRFDIGKIEDDCTKDYLLIGDDKHCGDKDKYSVTVNASGPIIVNVRMDGNNTNKEEGFFGTYEMIKCPEPVSSGSSSNCPSITTSEPLRQISEAYVTNPDIYETTPDSLDFFWL